jgi:hypothetical protein
LFFLKYIWTIFVIWGSCTIVRTRPKVNFFLIFIFNNKIKKFSFLAPWRPEWIWKIEFRNYWKRQRIGHYKRCFFSNNYKYRGIVSVTGRGLWVEKKIWNQIQYAFRKMPYCKKKYFLLFIYIKIIIVFFIYQIKITIFFFIYQIKIFIYAY